MNKFKSFSATLTSLLIILQKLFLHLTKVLLKFVKHFTAFFGFLFVILVDQGGFEHFFIDLVEATEATKFVATLATFAAVFTL